MSSSRSSRPSSAERTGRPLRAFIGRWFRQPQPIWLRRAVFQVHLWTGLAVGLYLVVISVTGSALVARVEITRALVPQRVTVGDVPRLSQDALRDAVSRVHADHAVVSVGLGRRPDSPVPVTLERNGIRTIRLFDPYRGADLGEATPRGVRALLWAVQLHDNLLMGARGRTLNGIAAVCATCLFLTGAVIWWPGRTRWWRSLLILPARSWQGMNWQLHSAVGFWCFAMLTLWSITGVYFVFPEPFNEVIEVFYPVGSGREQDGDAILSWFTDLHFGRFGGPFVRTVWIVLGLAPAVLFVTGGLMWWRRVARPWLGRRK